jgi:orotidine-5'-phosphate decarboxylase
MFLEKLRHAWSSSQSLLCVGLDPDPNKFPEHVKSASEPFFEFAKQIIDATAEAACCFKPQIAYYAAHGAEPELAKTISYIRKNHPTKPVILDSKRGDIGSTAEMYAAEAFDRYNADAVTVNPYLGTDSLEPFFRRKDRGTIVLCRTSNSGAVDLQNLMVDGKPLYQRVAERASQSWNVNKNLLLVLGATYPKEIAEVRAIAPEIPFLVPGVGAQGGDVKAVVESGKTKDGFGLVINSSRAILYASSGEDFAEAARKVAFATRDEINRFR